VTWPGQARPDVVVELKSGLALTSSEVREQLRTLAEQVRRSGRSFVVLSTDDLVAGMEPVVQRVRAVSDRVGVVLGFD